MKKKSGKVKKKPRVFFKKSGFSPPPPSEYEKYLRKFYRKSEHTRFMFITFFSSENPAV